jgi:hypothetical protein
LFEYPFGAGDELEVVVELGVTAALAEGGALGWEVESAAVELPEDGIEFG